VPLLQDVMQADGAHTSYGKYTLFSMYGSSANGNMAPIGFAILLGNENESNWSKFYDFLVRTHPSINITKRTILTDQDKGSIASVKSIIPNAGQFHCAFHRRMNIIK
jgi:MULE transposase domain